MEMKPQAIKMKIKIKMESIGIKNKSQSVEPSIQYSHPIKAGLKELHWGN
jgi:hypothetical protein